jgi:hypothetical protein
MATVGLVGPTGTGGMLALALAEQHDPSDPSEIEPGEAVTGKLAGGNADWYAFEARRGVYLAVNLEPSGDATVAVVVVGPDGVRHAGYLGPEVTSLMPVPATATGRHWVQVSAVDATDASYTLVVETREPNVG